MQERSAWLPPAFLARSRERSNWSVVWSRVEAWQRPLGVTRRGLLSFQLCKGLYPPSPVAQVTSENVRPIGDLSVCVLSCSRGWRPLMGTRGETRPDTSGTSATCGTMPENTCGLPCPSLSALPCLPLSTSACVHHTAERVHNVPASCIVQVQRMDPARAALRVARVEAPVSQPGRADRPARRVRLTDRA